eukprot:PhF_6_TR28138/c0_g1_i1/m.41666
MWSSDVVILSGFLGAGKTTVVQAILQNAPPLMKIAVLVNDMAEINIDASEIKKSTKDYVELTNGCICCNLRGELLEELLKVHKQKKFTHIIVECTGVAEPLQVAETFFLPAVPNPSAGKKKKTQKSAKKQDPGENMITLAQIGMNLTSCITLVDVMAFEHHLHSNLAKLLTDQVEFANVVVVSKIDLAPSEEYVQSVVTMIRRMNPRARIETAANGGLPNIPRLLTEKVFSLEEAQQQGEWLQSLELYVAHSESHEYGISSFVYRKQVPFHPRRLHDFLFRDLNKREDLKALAEVVRMKGYVWIGSVNKHNYMGYLDLSGFSMTVIPAEMWFSAIPLDSLPSDLTQEEIDEIRKDRLNDEFTYDRRQEIVVIGKGKQLKDIALYMDELLMTKEEISELKGQLKANQTKSDNDPFENWDEVVRAKASEGDHGHSHADGSTCYLDHGAKKTSKIEGGADISGENSSKRKTKK